MSKKITAFYLEGCPYCRQAREALKELTSENEKYSDIFIEWIEERQHPEISEKYNYYNVPSMFIEDEKIYEAHRGESFDECKENVRRVLEAAVS
ncbi:MAG: thioredoxin family protein [Synergistales bacterium]|nr:thioredoxin family protein [Synergistales bacterium]MDY6401740.1 thioredoxin family protein [Synergistales bacterium]MDY6404548.1 thioredoxin family protein [Synergistales bacterium]MDY6411175.1 thioredoxin family protein [Synergistales bacterium]MDY6413627.1 thioredoxin family protein [Synergistales bacterium]